MSISDTANAKRYASIAEASAAQCALYTEEARNSPQYASDARQSAEAAEAAQAQSATNAQQALQAASGASQNAASHAGSSNRSNGKQLCFGERFISRNISITGSVCCIRGDGRTFKNSARN